MNWSIERMTAFLRRAGIDPSTGERDTEHRDEDTDVLAFIPCQELGREEIDPDTWRA